MARQVYFDPYGMRVTGYQQGVRDEVAVQDATRRARMQDYEYNQVYPIQLQQLRRENEFSQFADPINRQLYGMRPRQAAASLAAQELPIYNTIGEATGRYDPYLTALRNYGSGQYTGNEQYWPAQVQQQWQAEQPDSVASSPADIASMYGLPTVDFQNYLSGLIPAFAPGTAEGVDQFNAFPRTLQTAQMNRSLRNDEFNYGLQDERLDNASVQRAIQLYYAVSKNPQLAAQFGLTAPTGGELAPVSPDGMAEPAAVDEDGL